MKRDWSRYWRSPDRPLEAMHAHFEQHVYHRHSHDSYSFGVTELGAQAFTCRGAGHTSAAGMVMAFNPDDPHDGHAATEHGFTYRIIHIGPELVSDVLADMSTRPAGLPLFADPVVNDPVLAGALHSLHTALLGNATALRRDELLTRTVAAMVRRAATPSSFPTPTATFTRALTRETTAPSSVPAAGTATPSTFPTRSAGTSGTRSTSSAGTSSGLSTSGGVAPGTLSTSRAVTPSALHRPGGVTSRTLAEVVRRRIDDAYLEDLTAADLAAAAGTSRFAVYRAFHTMYGMPPSDYQRQLRLRAARRLIAQGHPIGEAAVRSGFADQSHLTRWFTRYFGITPGTYQLAAA